MQLEIIKTTDTACVLSYVEPRGERHRKPERFPQKGKDSDRELVTKELMAKNYQIIC